MSKTLSSSIGSAIITVSHISIDPEITLFQDYSHSSVVIVIQEEM